MKTNYILLAGTAIAAFLLGRAVQRRLSHLTIVELYEKTGPDITDITDSVTIGYMRFNEAGVEFVQNINDASPVTLEKAIKIKNTLKDKIEANQGISFISIEDAALIAITQQEIEIEPV